MGRKRKPIAIDLFSGAGGLSLGLTWAGFKVIGAVDIEPAACETYSVNHPKVYLWQEDIRQLSADEIMEQLKLKTGQLDLLAGCPPCQGFSTIRTHNGHPTSDNRNDLVFEFLRIAKSLLPKTIMMENVPGLSKDYRMDVFTADLEKLGYHCDRQVVDASDYGVPQRRRRMIFVASRQTKIISIEIPKLSRRTTVRDAFDMAKLKPPGMSGDPLHDIKENRTPEVMERIKLVPKDGGSRQQLPKCMQLKCHIRYPKGFKDVYGRMKLDDVSPTITGGCSNPSKGRFIHPLEDRTITLREAALLQSFPKNYYFSLKGGKQQIALQIGNALPPLFIQFHAEHIRRNLL